MTDEQQHRGPGGPGTDREPGGPADERRIRDRDAAGRARSTRPRDGLGRPLPHGSSGVPRQPEGVVRSAQQTLAEAQRLLDEGMPFHAHEVLEDAWKAAADQDRALWRGLAQLAVGLTHAARGNARGAVALLRRGAAALAPFRERAPHGVDAAGLIDWSTQLAGDLDSGAGAGPGGPAAPRLCGRSPHRAP